MRVGVVFAAVPLDDDRLRRPLLPDEQQSLGLFRDSVDQEVRAHVVDVRNKYAEVLGYRIFRVVVLGHLGNYFKPKNLDEPKFDEFEALQDELLRFVVSLKNN